MKAVLISINPKWCEKIANNQKTIEVQKTKPNLDVPFKCYIYETKGKVIGEFVCDDIDDVKCYSTMAAYNNNCTAATGLEDWELVQYSDGGLLYFWHISNLKIYNKPRELSEYSFVCQYKECENCKYNVYEILPFAVISIGCDRHINEAPQSWCYVEDGEYGKD